MLLFPISVVKTRMQVASGKGEVAAGAGAVVRSIVRADGIRGLYRGFGTVLFGTIPSRIVMLTSLETTKLAASDFTKNLGMSEAVRVPLANGIAGLVSSLLSQSVFVPIDVVCIISLSLSLILPSHRCCKSNYTYMKVFLS